MKCDKCYLQSNPSVESYFISDNTTQKGYQFECKVDSSVQLDDFSVFGIDIIYSLSQGNQIMFNINQSYPNHEITNHLPALLEEAEDIVCPDRREYFRATFQITQALNNGQENSLKLQILKQSEQQQIGIKMMKIWANCAQNCQKCNDKYTCKECVSGYSMKQLPSGLTVCEKDDCTIEYCSFCLRGNDQEICQICKNGYILNNDSTQCIIEEPDYCNGGNCINKHSQKRMLSVNVNECFDCPQFCDECIDPQTCVKCSDKYYVQSGKCLNCIENCFKCTDGKQCLSCSDGYLLNKGKCVITCNSNQYVDSVKRECIDCSFQCEKCKNSTTCDKCSEKYYLSQNQCKECIQGCQICLNGENCQKCQSTSQPAYYLNKGKCVLRCNSNQYLNDDKSECFDCMQYCVECDNSTSCKKCIEKYYVNYDQTCKQLIQPPEKTKWRVQSQTILDYGYSIIISFHQTIDNKEVDNNKFLTISITEVNNYTFQVKDFTPDEFTLEIRSQTNIKYQKIKITIIDEIFILKNRILFKEVEEDLKPYVIIPEDQKQPTKDVSSIGKSVSIVAVGSILPIMIFSNFYILINTIDITGFLYYLLFINIRHPDNVIQFYDCFKNFQFPFIPNIFDSLIDPNYTQVAPPKFMEKGTDRMELNLFYIYTKFRYFLRNSGQTITIWIIIISIYVFAKIQIGMKVQFLQNYLQKAIKQTWEFSAFLDLLWNTYIYLVVGVMLQFSVYDKNDSSWWLNYTFHTIFMIIILTSPLFVFILIYRINDKNADTYQNKISTLLNGIKVQNEVPQQQQSKSQINEEGQQAQQLQQNKCISLINLQQDTENNLEKKNIKFKMSESNIQTNQELFQTQPILEDKSITIYNKLIKKLLFGIIIVSEYAHPYLQLASLCILNMGIITFIVKVKPFKSCHENVKYAAGEVILILIQICNMFLVEDSQEDDNELQRFKIGWVIVSLGLFILFWNTMAVVIELLQPLFTFLVKAIKNRCRSSSKVLPSSNNELPQKSNQQQSKTSEQYDNNKINSIGQQQLQSSLKLVEIESNNSIISQNVYIKSKQELSVKPKESQQSEFDSPQNLLMDQQIHTSKQDQDYQLNNQVKILSLKDQLPKIKKNFTITKIYLNDDTIEKPEEQTDHNQLESDNKPKKNKIKSNKSKSKAKSKLKQQ